MGKLVSSEYIIIPGGPVPRKGAASEAPSPSELSARLKELVDAKLEGKPIQEIVGGALSAIADLYGLSGLVLSVVSEDIKPVFRWGIHGYSEEKAKALIENLGAEYHPKELTSEILSERYRISKNAYYVSAEEWLKFSDADPFSDHPAYYLNPEEARLPRKSPDEFHESDFYSFALRNGLGELLAWLDVNYSYDGKLPTKETIEGIEIITSLLSLMLEQEAERIERRKPPSKIAQRTDLLEDVLKIASAIVSERDIRKLSDMVLTSVSSLFGFGKVTLVVYDETLGAFRWVAAFGYGDEVVREIRNRTIPMEVVLEDLKEGRRIGKSAYFTSEEDLSSNQRAFFVRPRVPVEKPCPPRRKDEFREGDCFAFSLHDSAGRIVGVIYPSEPRDGKLPDRDTIETMEIFSSLAEVAVENARLSLEREQALRLSSQRTEQLSRILDVTSSIMVVRNLDQMLDDLLRTLAQLLGIKRMVLGIRHEELGVYKIEAVFGYLPKAAEAILTVTYPIEEVDGIMALDSAGVLSSAPKWRKKVGRMTYYMPAESYSISPADMPFYPEPELARLPRKGKGHWHELDYMDSFILDKKGVPIAYLEILKPRDERVPDPDTIEIIEIFTSLAGIAIENSRMFQEHIDSRRNAEMFTDVLSHDIKNYNQAVIGYLDLLKSKLEKPDAMVLIDKIAEQIMNTSRLAGNVRTMSRVTFGDIDLVRMDLGAVLLECSKSLSQYYPARKIAVKHDIERETYFVAADELLREVFTNILTNAAKYDTHETVEIDMEIDSMYEDGHKHWIVSVADRGVGIPDDVKSIIFDRFSKAPRKKGSGLGLHIVKTVSNRYGGKAWVEDRVPGDHTKGTVFKVKLPAAN